MMKWLKNTFVGDDDGFTAKDFLLTISFGLYAVFWVFGMVLSIKGVETSEGFMALLAQMRGILEPIIYGTFGLAGVQMGASAYQSRKESKGVGE